MTGTPSIERTLVRTLLITVVATIAIVLVVGGVIAAVIVVKRDDGAALAQVRTVGSELRNHAGEPAAALDALVRDELDEQRWFGRHVEVWTAGTAVGPQPTMLGAWATSPDGCVSARVAGQWQRICIAHVTQTTTIVAATPLRPMLGALRPMLEGVGAVAAAALLIVFSLSRSIVRRTLRPLVAFEDEIGRLPARGYLHRVSQRWAALEVERLAAVFNELLSRIECAVEREQRFVADAAHELRTPLTRLRAQLELTMSGLDDVGQDVVGAAKRELTSAVRDCEGLVRMTEALLALARDDIARDDAVDLTDVATACQTRLAAGLYARIEIAAPTPSVVRGDESLLALAVGNLVDNALKFSDGVVRVSVETRDGSPTVIVDDHGPGISPDEQARVRLPFVRGSARRSSVKGSGLGLALVDHIAALHDGKLTLENKPAGGLRAALTMPAWRERPLADDAPLGSR